MSTLNEDLSYYIQRQAKTKAVYISIMPPEPEKAICITPYQNQIGRFGFDYGICTVYYQIAVRGRQYKPCEDLAYGLYEKLNSGLTEEERPILLKKGRKVICRPLQRPYYMKKDSLGLIWQGFNLVVHTDRR